MITLSGVDPRMIANNLTPLEPIHPGELLKEELQVRRITQKQFAKQFGVPYTALNEILNGKRPVTAQVALVFEAALGIDADMLVSISPLI